MPSTTAPRWCAFLAQVTDGDADLQAYLQRVVGYCLTGSVREHVLFFVYGTGANGKSVFVNSISRLLGDYAVDINTEMLMASKSDRHPTEVARLRGARLAVGNEVEIGRSWAESRIKSLTGGDRVAARFMRQDFFEFDPQFKLMIVGNHRPSFHGIDEAIRRRIHLVPFTVTIPAEERDPDLPEKLKKEWPAILRWAIDGCVAWQEQGLNPPEAVLAATSEYLEEEDAIGRWLEECTEKDASEWTSSGSLYESWKTWTETNGEFTTSKKNLSQELQARGFASKKKDDRGYQGLRLRRSRQPSPFDL